MVTITNELFLGHWLFLQLYCEKSRNPSLKYNLGLEIFLDKLIKPSHIFNLSEKHVFCTY